MHLYGRSLGGAVCLFLATEPSYRPEIAGIILENTFTSLTEVFFTKVTYLPVFLGLFAFSKWESRKIISQIDLPMMFIRSLQDKMIHPCHME
jgi:alpha-beta hydrolase superfamily lysophospholipase